MNKTIFGVVGSLIPLKLLDKHHNCPVFCVIVCSSLTADPPDHPLPLSSCLVMPPLYYLTDNPHLASQYMQQLPTQLPRGNLVNITLIYPESIYTFLPLMSHVRMVLHKICFTQRRKKKLSKRSHKVRNAA